MLEQFATNITLNLLAGVKHHVQSHRAGLDLLPAYGANCLRHRVILEVEIERLPRHELLVAVRLGAEEVVQVLGVGHHVLLNALLGLVLGSTQVTDVELRLVGLCHDLCQDLHVLWSVSALGELGEMDVEAVHGVDTSAALEAFELSEGRAVLAMLVNSFLSEIITAAVVADCPALHLALHVLHDVTVLRLVLAVALALFGRLEMFLDGPEPPESFLTSVADVLDVSVDGNALSPVFPGVQHFPPAVLADLATAGAVLTAARSAGRSGHLLGSLSRLFSIITPRLILLFIIDKVIIFCTLTASLSRRYFSLYHVI